MILPNLKFLSRENALALLPVPSTSVEKIDAALHRLNQGENGGIAGSIERLTRINKATRFNTKSWGRLKQGASVKTAVSYSFITFDEEADPADHVVSFCAFCHTSTQAPMLLVSFDRCSGARPTSLAEPGNTYVLSRRVISLPLQCVLKHWGDPTKGHMIYEHDISPMDHAGSELRERFKSARYIGLTSRNWQTRYREHQRDALTGSELLFHTTLASVFPEGGIAQAGMGSFEIVRCGLCLTSELEYVNLTYGEAMQVEEQLVERTLNPAGLNMIPGGFAGIKLLHKLGFLKRSTATAEERNLAATNYVLQKKRISSPAPWISDRWQTDEYYERVVLNRSKTLSREQILSIRQYGLNWNGAPEVIASLSGASARQVRDILRGKYYSRVK
ncbi:hypothetical protein [Variovorax sp. AFSI2.2]|uniref:hypothetical protein n=1 Tax=Variovorax sp. AFSI2.2 TaxID=3384160 RepID=UPI003EB942D3